MTGQAASRSSAHGNCSFVKKGCVPINDARRHQSVEALEQPLPDENREVHDALVAHHQSARAGSVHHLVFRHVFCSRNHAPWPIWKMVGSRQSGPTVLTAQPNQRGTAVNIVAKLRARRDGDDESGFTLIELMVVVLIIAILIAIAIPTFLGARQRAQDKAAQSSLRNSLTAAKTIYTDGENYNDATVDDTGTLKATEPSLDFVAAGTVSGNPKEVSVATSTNQIVMAAVSKGGTCFAIQDVVTPAGQAGTSFSKVTGDCTATNAASMTNWDTDGW